MVAEFNCTLTNIIVSSLRRVGGEEVNNVEFHVRFQKN